MSLYDYKFNLKYGVIDTKNNGKVTSWNEKPEYSAKINIGCYVMEPEVFQLIPKNKQYGMDDVIRKNTCKEKESRSVISKKGFIDIGDKETYEKTNEEYSKSRRLKMSDIKIRDIVESDIENGFLESLDSLKTCK